MKKAVLFAVMLSVASILFVGSCTTMNPKPTPEQLQNADYGRYPDDYQDIVKEYYSRVLFDPYSAHYRWMKPPYKGYFQMFGKLKYGYIVHVGVNAKNRFGGYVGEKQEGILIYNDVVIEAFPLALIGGGY